MKLRMMVWHYLMHILDMRDKVELESCPVVTQRTHKSFLTSVSEHVVLKLLLTIPATELFATDRASDGSSSISYCRGEVLQQQRGGQSGARFSQKSELLSSLSLGLP